MNFSHNGLLVLYKMSREIITNEPKNGILFPIHFSIPRVLDFSSITTNYGVNHKCQGHRNSIMLYHFSNSYFYWDIKINFKLLPLIVLNINYEKVNIFLFKVLLVMLQSFLMSLPFRSFGSRAAKYFDVIHSNLWGHFTNYFL